MISQVIVVRDLKAEAFGRPMFVPALGSAIRSFTDEVNRNHEDNQMFHHCGDFELFHLGVFNDTDGSFDLLSHPKLVITGLQVKQA
jgi:hypothetical protein